MRKIFTVSAFLGVFACISLVSCTKQPIVESCPVLYTIDTDSKYELVDKWQFVGFENTATGEIQPPICGQIESWIKFTEEATASKGSAANKYNQIFEGVALINHFRGTFQENTNGELLVSPTINTTVNGTDQVKEFEGKFHHLLQQVNRYEINYNELTLIPEGGTEVLKFVAE